MIEEQTPTVDEIVNSILGLIKLYKTFEFHSNKFCVPKNLWPEIKARLKAEGIGSVILIERVNYYKIYVGWANFRAFNRVKKHIERKRMAELEANYEQAT